jgi:hypothetical protein
MLSKDVQEWSTRDWEEWVMGEVERYFPTVHILKGNRPMCGIFLRAPGSWPQGHTFVSFLDPSVLTDSTCTDCKEAYAQAHQPS